MPVMARPETFVLPCGHAEKTRMKKSRIEDNFGVRLEFTSQAEAIERLGQEWIEIHGFSESQARAKVNRGCIFSLHGRGFIQPDPTNRTNRTDLLIELNRM